MDVYKLTKSLSPLQQRYFRLYSTLHVPEGRETKYIAAFDAVLNGKQLKKKSDEADLFQVILRVMRMYESGGVAREVRNAILDAEFLISKAIYAEAASILKRAEKEATELELFGALADIINLRAEIMQLAGFRKDTSVGKILLDELSLIERIENAARYRQYSLTLFEKIRSKGKLGVNEQIDYLRHVLKDPYVKNEGRAITLRAKIIRLQLHATFHLLEGNLEDALAYQKKLVQLMTREPAQVKWKPFNHVILLNNYAITALRCNKFRETQNAISAMREIPKQFGIRPTAELDAQLFSFSAMLELDMYAKKNETKIGTRRGEKIVKAMKSHQKYIPPSLHMVILFNYGHLLFMRKEPSKAYTQFSAITQLPYTGVREDLKAASRLLQALCLYESGDTDYLSYAVINLKRQAKKQHEKYSSEIALLNTIGRIIDTEPAKQKTLWEKLYVKLQELKSNPLDAALYENFDILDWVRRQI